MPSTVVDGAVGYTRELLLEAPTSKDVLYIYINIYIYSKPTNYPAATRERLGRYNIVVVALLLAYPVLALGHETRRMVENGRLLWYHSERMYAVVLCR